MTTVQSTFDIDAVRVEGFRFSIHFPGTELEPIVTDEPPPLGQGRGPNPSRMLAAAVVNCLAASLLFALQKKGVSVAGLKARSTVELVRNETHRLRIKGISVMVTPSVASTASAAAIDEAIDLFEDFCVVTQSVRQGIPVDVRVEPSVASP
jgi:uncharacterized OsmC-like protein